MFFNMYVVNINEKYFQFTCFLHMHDLLWRFLFSSWCVWIWKFMLHMGGGKDLINFFSKWIANWTCSLYCPYFSIDSFILFMSNIKCLHLSVSICSHYSVLMLYLYILHKSIFNKSSNSIHIQLVSTLRDITWEISIYIIFQWVMYI